ncbi:MAG: HEAT repeat domain-containing protein [Candidatus Igneacidithiobacillus chanchocoensis]
MNHHYYPRCYAEIPIGAEVCPACGRDIESWERNTPYFDRLLWALRNPHPEVLMGAILSLQHQGRSEAALPLAQCALKLRRRHPAHSVREAAQYASLESAGSAGDRDSAEWKKRLGSILKE